MAINRPLFLMIFLSFLPLISSASTKNELAKKIVFLTQTITNDYLYYYYDNRDDIALNRMKNAIKEFENDLVNLAKEFDDKESKNMLEFLSYSKNQIKEILHKKVSRDNALQMLDHNSAIFEGIYSILKVDEDSRLDLMKISTLYMKSNLHLENRQKTESLMKKEIQKLDKKLLENKTWDLYKKMVDKDDLFLPNINLVLIEAMEKEI